MRWNVLESKKDRAQDNMEKDKLLLEKLKIIPECFLHFYDWVSPSVTYGHFLLPEEHVSLSKLECLGISLAKRPTGGGLLFHGKDFTFSVLISSQHPFYSLNTLENYAFINKRIQKALQRSCLKSEFLLHQHVNIEDPYKKYCMASPTIYDILVDNKKVCGGAQRRKNYGFLHQASISLSVPNEEELSCLLDKEVAFKMKKKTYPLADYSEMREQELRVLLRENLIKEMTT